MKSKSLAAVLRLSRRDLTPCCPYNTCMGLQMTSLLPTSSTRLFSRPCAVSHCSLLITSHSPPTAQPNNLRLLYQASRFIGNWRNWTEVKRMVLMAFRGGFWKENADLLAAPRADILNSSYQEGSLSPSWKEADVVPVPKQRPVQNISKHLRYNSLTPILSKIDLLRRVLRQHFRLEPAVLSKIDPQQFGTVPKSSTTHASISMIRGRRP